VVARLQDREKATNIACSIGQRVFQLSRNAPLAADGSPLSSSGETVFRRWRAVSSRASVEVKLLGALEVLQPVAASGGGVSKCSGLSRRSHDAPGQKASPRGAADEKPRRGPECSSRLCLKPAKLQITAAPPQTGARGERRCIGDARARRSRRASRGFAGVDWGEARHRDHSIAPRGGKKTKRAPRRRLALALQLPALSPLAQRVATEQSGSEVGADLVLLTLGVVGGRWALPSSRSWRWNGGRCAVSLVSA